MAEPTIDTVLSLYLAARGFDAAKLAAMGIDLANTAVTRSLRRQLGLPLPPIARPRCGARTRVGTPCKAPAVWDHDEDRPRTKRGRCRMHGGLSTGPRTTAGQARAREALERVNALRSKARIETRAA